jgi:hypothetical protein
VDEDRRGHVVLPARETAIAAQGSGGTHGPYMGMRMVVSLEDDAGTRVPAQGCARESMLSMWNRAWTSLNNDVMHR